MMNILKWTLVACIFLFFGAYAYQESKPADIKAAEDLALKKMEINKAKQEKSDHEAFEQKVLAKNEQEKAETAANKQREVDNAKAEVDNLPSVTAYELVAAYENNPIAADKQFKGEKYKISGTIDGIDTNVIGTPLIHLKANMLGTDSIVCFFDRSDKNSLINLNNGQKITVLCTVNGKVMGSPQSDSCSIIK